MDEITLGDGEVYNIQGLQKYVCKMGIRKFIRPLSKGEAVREEDKIHFKTIVEKLEEIELSERGKKFNETLKDLIAKQSSFDNAKYKHSSLTERGRYTTKFGTEYAQLLEDTLEGHQPSNDLHMSMQDYFTKLTKIWYKRDQKTGIEMPGDLPLK